MGAKIITLSQKDQDLLRVLINRAIEPGANAPLDLIARGRDLKERIL